MSGFIDRIILLVVSIVAMFFWESLSFPLVTCCLIAIIYFSLGFYFEDKKCHRYINIAVGLLMLCYDGLLPIIILMVYEVLAGALRRRKWELSIIGLLLILYFSLWKTGRSYFYFEIIVENYLQVIWIVLGIIMAGWMAYRTWKYELAVAEKSRLRDDSEEFRQLMLQKNRLMVKQQDSEIAMATLKERNRIAREIHDNVGHLLSRSILQVGALRTVYKEHEVSQALEGLADTLNESMTSVRNSVHNLHNESIDLEKNIRNLLSDSEKFDTSLEYDFSENAPRKVKYCIIAVITEALSNATKHSNGSKIEVILREHPGIFQVVFWDNGTGAKIKESGIGLHNMESRVRDLGGNISFSTENGFRIFISIPKKGDED